MTTNPTPEQAREALAVAERAATSPSGSKLVQTMTILVGGLTFIAPLVGAGGWIRDHQPGWMIAGLAIGGFILAATIVLSRIPMKFDRGFRMAYLASVGVNALLYVTYLMLMLRNDRPSWSYIALLAALLLEAPFIAAISFHFTKKRAQRAGR